MTHPAVSVLIPCRDAGRFIAATLESALEQTQPPAEVLVVDDGSSDDSREIIRRFGSRVTVVASPGRGASAARNHAMTCASGAFLQFLDADDLLHPHALESRVAALTSSGADVAVSDWRRLTVHAGRWQGGAVESAQWPADVPLDLAIFQGYWAPPAAILYRREMCARIGRWSDTLPVIQDARFLLDAARAGGRFVHVAGVGADYRQHAAGSLSSRSPERFWLDILRNTREVEAIWNGTATDPGRRRALAASYANCVAAGLRLSRPLFRASLTELERFPEWPLRPALRAGITAARTIGYGPAHLWASLPGIRSRL